MCRTGSNHESHRVEKGQIMNLTGSKGVKSWVEQEQIIKRMESIINHIGWSRRMGGSIEKLKFCRIFFAYVCKTVNRCKLGKKYIYI